MKHLIRTDDFTTREIEEILAGVDAMSNSEKEKALLKFCIRAAQKDNYKITKDDIDALKALGWKDTELLEAVAIVGYFNYINTLSNVFGLGE